ncbi:MAG: NAD(P)-binding protein [Candidatus Pacebacteria bacterium]|nr:NAD(P)-binding protein [Candidatus Paceibacterota bacterium]MBT4652727.1 NAD(P)-binding protein [Candidatus Paceibacterota bacterium]MBT6755884.1 NAD(P)-binding protein [Candidatus Paceibacterota bacterium]MBT6921097.1 NAD(P)-binding protein [Candidatus Paceibacterota bacterium]
MATKLKTTKQKQPSILILGAGPTGLGAAYRLQELGHKNFLILEKNKFVGGLATSFTDKNGFTWDIGGHVIHSHYKYFDQVFNKHILLHSYTLQREAWVWLYKKFIPYPFQYNLHYLPQKIQNECIEGLKNLKKNIAKLKSKERKSKSFLDWILENFGKGIANHFLIPQNIKTWGYPLENLNYSWIGDRVAQINLKRTLKNIAEKKDDIAWGPNNLFHFPKKRGTRFIWEKIAKTIPKEKIQINNKVEKINREKKYVQTANGQKYFYDSLITSIPLTKLLKKSKHPLTKKAQKNLVSSQVTIVGLGVKGKTLKKLKTKCWMYFPEKNIPFFRATVFSNYSKNNVPDHKNQWSLMLEISQTKNTNFNNIGKLIDQVIDGAIQTKLIKNKNEVISTWKHTEKLAYPTPTISRDLVIDNILKTLQKEQIYSRGRFGAWKYEVGNMDHSFMQGVEAVDNILNDKKEVTIWKPNQVNG